MARVWVALGSNLENPRAQLCQARATLAGQLREVRASSLYESAPWGYADQPNFINAVIAYDCDREPEALLDWLQTVETAQHRRRLFKNGPRTLDLDLLLYDQRQLQTPRLTLPHPRLDERVFVLVPLAEISPELVLPDRPESVAQRAAAFPPDAIKKLPPTPDWP